MEHNNSSSAAASPNDASFPDISSIPPSHSPALRRATFLFSLIAALSLALVAPNIYFRNAMLIVAGLVVLALGVEALAIILCAKSQSFRDTKVLAVFQTKLFWLPNPGIGGELVKQIFGHRHMTGRSKGGLRKYISWMHSPVADCHQEVMEKNEIYAQVKKATSHLIARTNDITAIANKHIDQAIARERTAFSPWTIMELSRIVRPIIINSLFEFIFGRAPSKEELDAFVASNDNLVATVGALTVPKMDIRMKALSYIQRELEATNGRPDIFGDDCTLTVEQRAKYVLGVWIHSGVAQAYRHAMKGMLATLRNKRVFSNFKKDVDGSYADAILLEANRMFPGVVMTDRRAVDDIQVEGAPLIERDTTVFFHFQNYHTMGFERPDEFIPERWNEALKKESNYMPFGTGQRRCPAERLSTMLSKQTMVRLLNELDIHVGSGLGIIKSYQHRYWSLDICCIVRRPSLGKLSLWAIRKCLNAGMTLYNVRKGLIVYRMVTRQDEDCARYKAPAD